MTTNDSNYHIYVVRHGQSDRNVYGHSDVCDIGLNKMGIEQASHLEGYFDVIICSNLRRAKQTLQFSKLKYGRIQPSEMCREQRKEISDLLEGESLSDLYESSERLKQRANEFKKLLRLYPKSKRILIISHYHFLNALTGHKLENAQIIGYMLD